MTVDGLIVRVRVKPGARRERVEEGRGGVLLIEVKEEAERNAANERVRELVARHFGVPIARVSLHTGTRGRAKTFRVIS